MSAQTALQRGRKDGRNSRSGGFFFFFFNISSQVHVYEDGKKIFLKKSKLYSFSKKKKIEEL